MANGCRKANPYILLLGQSNGILKWQWTRGLRKRSLRLRVPLSKPIPHHLNGLRGLSLKSLRFRGPLIRPIPCHLLLLEFVKKVANRRNQVFAVTLLLWYDHGNFLSLLAGHRQCRLAEYS
jgi:hypothetical protein